MCVSNRIYGAPKVYPTAFTPVNILSGFTKTGIYPFNPSSVDDRQLAPSNALSKNLLLLLQLLRQSSHFQKMNQVTSSLCFFRQRRRRFAQRFEEGYDILEIRSIYIAWVRINHPERCLSVGSTSSVSAISSANHVTKTSSSQPKFCRSAI